MQGTIARALQGYYSLLTAQNALAVAKESEGYAKASYSAAELRHKIGQVPLADKLQAKGSYSQALLGTQQAENGLALQQASLAVLMGLDAGTPVTVADVDDHSLAKDPFGGEVADLIAAAKQERHDLEASRISLRASETSLKALKRSNLASISATASMDMNNDRVNILGRTATRGQAVGLSVSIPIFTGFSQTLHFLREPNKRQ